MQESSQPLANQSFGFRHDAVDELLAGRYIANQAGDHAAGPGACIHIALLHDARIHAADFFGDVGEGQLGPKLAFLGEQAIDGMRWRARARYCAAAS
jgi:hypothetical protein